MLEKDCKQSWRDATVGKALTLCISQHSLEERNLQNKHTLKDLGAGEVAQQLSAMFNSMAPGTYPTGALRE